MARPRLAIASALLLGACALHGPSLGDWVRYVEEVDALGCGGLGSRVETEAAAYRDSPDDAARLRLGYLLGSCPEYGGGPGEGRAMLDEIPPQSAYAPVRDLMGDRIDRKAQIRELERQLRERDETVGELAGANARAAELEARVRELQAQLDALKSIETDITEGQRAIQELSE